MMAQAAQKAFTLMELMMVMLITAIATAIFIPAITVMMSVDKTKAGIDTIQMAASVARAFAVRDLKARFEEIGGPAGGVNGDYSGAAVIFTPAGELRVVENVPFAQDLDDEEFLEANGLNGYADLPDVDYIKMPKGAGVMGIARNQFGLKFLPPPFAVRFNEHGHLIAGISFTPNHIRRIVFYDANYDFAYEDNGGGNGSDRDEPYGAGPYDPAAWDPDSAIYVGTDDDDEDAPGIHPDSHRHKLPFEGIETVVGLIVFNKIEFQNLALELTQPRNPGDPLLLPEIDEFSDGSVEAQLGTWLLENGKGVFFNRYTGAILDKGVALE